MNEFDEDLLFPVQAASDENFTLDEQRFLLSMMTWSFSRLNSYDHCPYEWKRKYLLGQPGISSAMAQYGGYMHRILEMYLKCELSIFELPMYYEEHYNENVNMDFPKNKYVDLAEKYYFQGLDYFNNFSWDLDGFEILGVEKKVEYVYQGYTFVGFIDLLLRDLSDGKLIILDHKSTVLKKKRNGEISKTDKPHFEEFCKQLLMYSHEIMQEYGEDSVKSLQWNMFRDQSFIAVPWTRDAYEEAMQWAIDTIHRIEQDVLWLPNNNNFFWCNNLCSQRQSACPYKM